MGGHRNPLKLSSAFSLILLISAHPSLHFIDTGLEYEEGIDLDAVKGVSGFVYDCSSLAAYVLPSQLRRSVELIA